ncbi:MAG: ribonuclease III [Phycisphaerae bacterium]|nr:ribonuclease III [Phycisphaerae bacterium]|tara:strand:- start:4904 stop:5632 length:729 start_codon:yes stop_codon:yes gene_type:complete
MDNDWIQAVQSILGYEFTDKTLLEQALSHSSAVDQRENSNERLEFLGDAVLGFVICNETFERYPEYEEGEMTKIKSAVVSRRVCAEVADELDLGRLLRVGKGMNALTLPSSVTGAAYEAVIGAIYLDGGFEPANDFVLRSMTNRISNAAASTHQENYKSVLQQVGQKLEGVTPSYVVLDEKGPDHAKCFEICVELNGKRFTPQWGASKKQAEQLAALEALKELDIAYEHVNGAIEIKEFQGE